MSVGYMSRDTDKVPNALTKTIFRKKLRNLILATWNIPPVFGLSFILFIEILSTEQMIGILTTPIEPGFIVFWIFFSIWYFRRYTQPVAQYLDTPTHELAMQAARCIRRFPLHYWGLFLSYLILAPASVILAAEIYTDFVARPIDWFRIHLVALIVSIIVGLPIFFLILDLFGSVMGFIPMVRPHITIKAKVFLIGALIPLLIDTMLVQYYWTRTGYFTTETFMVWLLLELLAIGGSMIFVHSFSHSLRPLESLSDENSSGFLTRPIPLRSESTDEIGVLIKNYHKLLTDLKIQREMLELNNMLLSRTGHGVPINQIADTIVNLSKAAIEADRVFLILYDEKSKQLVGVTQSGDNYRKDGYYRLALDDVSMAVMTFKAGETFAISDVQTDPRCNPEMRSRFNVQSALATPLFVNANPIGVLIAVSNENIHEYNQREVTILEGFAKEAALAIHTEQLHQARQEAEAKGKEHQELVKLLLQSTEEAIYGVDMHGICTFVNRACVRMLGYDDENELIGQNMHDLIHHTLPNGEPYPKEKCKVRLSTLRGSSGHSIDEVHWRKDGSSFPVEYWSHPIRKEGQTIGTVVSFVDITERVRSEQTIRHMAYHDTLTGLVNRHEFENRLSHAIQDVKETGLAHALLYIDLDQFKVVNDTSGHEAGDELLRQLKDIFHKPVRERDTVARLGGDEFAILLVNCPIENAQEIANQIVHLLREFRFIWKDKIFSIGASIGISLIDNPVLTTAEILKRADIACYKSKDLGRNRVHLFSEGDSEFLKREAETSLISQIHAALDKDRFILYHQPIKDLRHNNKDYCEIFVRMQNDNGEIIPADLFVSSAERYKLMPEIDRWVIRETFLHAAKAMKKAGGSHEILYFINLSGTSLNDESFLTFVQDELNGKISYPESICFEVTETAAIANINQAQKFIHTIKSLGCRFALDDFGSGLSSFSYLKDLDVDFLKIDGSFVRDMLNDNKDYSIVEAITQLGRSMGIQTVAEYVENDAIMQAIKHIGVDFAQGYGIARPQPLVEQS